ncbi:MAG: (4Fe-4S)-binding protein [Syntrophobacter sp. DG_60]|nr:MAG: (4Fe-4S)-binding protein [Syntrophobacter sp. DG_60]
MAVAKAIDLSERKTELRNKVKDILPEGGNLDLCFTCGSCVAGCPATGLEGLDPRKFLRMVVLGLDEEVLSTPWVWMCTICDRCKYACPMKVDIPRLVYEVRAMWPRDKRPTGIRKSCDFHVKTGGAMGVSKEDWTFVVNDVLEEFRQESGWGNLRAPMDKEGAYFCLNQNSREPVTEPEEMVPLWRILHLAGADWTYPSEMWAGENYCMFLADDESWQYTIRTLAKKVDDLRCKVLINTE